MNLPAKAISGSIEWSNDLPIIDYSSLPIIDYSSEEMIKYECQFIDAKTEEDFQSIPFNFDTIYFSVFYAENNIVIHKNQECTSGCFFVPFLLCPSKEELICRISSLVSRFSEYVSKKKIDSLPQLRVFVYRKIDNDGNRHFAIASTNLFPKSEEIHKLGIKTIQEKTMPPIPEECWEVVSREMGIFHEEPSCCIIDKREIMAFEDRVVPVDKNNTEVMFLRAKNEGFAAEHYMGGTKDSYFNPKTMEKGSVFKLPVVRMISLQELNQSIRWLSESFRELTGSVSIEVVALYSDLPGGYIDASAIVYKNNQKSKEETEVEF